MESVQSFIPSGCNFYPACPVYPVYPVASENGTGVKSVFALI